MLNREFANELSRLISEAGCRQRDCRDGTPEERGWSAFRWKLMRARDLLPVDTEPEPCEVCKDRGWLLSYNVDRAVYEIQRCDTCKRYDSDKAAGNVAVPDLERGLCALALTVEHERAMRLLNSVHDVLQDYVNGMESRESAEDMYRRIHAFLGAPEPEEEEV